MAGTRAKVVALRAPRAGGARLSRGGLELRVEVDRRRPSGRRLLCGLLEMSYVDLANPRHLEFEYMRRMGDVIDLAWPADAPLTAVHLGGAACTLPRYIAAMRPRSRSEVYEYDPQVLEVAQAELGLRPSRALRLRVGDARTLLRGRPDRSADLVIGDAFEGTSVPAALLTQDFAREVRRVLRPEGLYLLNVIDAPPLSLARAQVASLTELFSELALIGPVKLLHGRSSGNIVLVGADRALPLGRLGARAARAPRPEQVLAGDELARFVRRARPLRDADLC